MVFKSDWLSHIQSCSQSLHLHTLYAQICILWCSLIQWSEISPCCPMTTSQQQNPFHTRFGAVGDVFITVVELTYENVEDTYGSPFMALLWYLPLWYFWGSIFWRERSFKRATASQGRIRARVRIRIRMHSIIKRGEKLTLSVFLS